jgi:hypothetical protein
MKWMKIEDLLDDLFLTVVVSLADLLKPLLWEVGLMLLTDLYDSIFPKPKETSKEAQSGACCSA